MSSNMSRATWLCCATLASANLAAAPLEVERHQDVVYFSDSESTQIQRYSLEQEKFIAPISLASQPRALFVDDSGIYISYGQKINRMNLDGSGEKLFRETSKEIGDIDAIDDILILAAYEYLQTLSKSTGLFIDEKETWYSSSDICTDVSGRQIISRSSGGSPADISKHILDSDGKIGAETDSPYHGGYQIGSNCRVFPTQNKVTDTSGNVYHTIDLTHAGSLGGDYESISFWQGLPIVLRNNTLYAYNKAMLETGLYKLASFEAKSIKVFEDKIFVFESKSGTGKVEVVDVSLLKPADPVAPVDPTGLAYSPDDMALDGNEDTLFILSKKHLNIFRWSVSAQKYLESIPLANPPAGFSYSKEHNRIYLSYSNGAINYIDLEDNSEKPFTTLPGPANVISSAGKYLFTRDESGAWGTFSTYGKDGVRAFSKDWSYPTSEVVWSEAYNRIYYISGFSPSDLHWHTVDQSSGVISNDHDSPYHSSYGWGNPIRISANGKRIALPSGRIVSGTEMKEIKDLSDDYYEDLSWLNGNLYTIREVDSGTYTQLERWDANLDKVSADTVEFSGAAVAVVSIKGSDQLLLIYSSEGVPQFELFKFIEEDYDGDGVYDSEDAFPAQADEWIDSDDDGVGDNADTDDDNDDVSDDEDAFPLDPFESVDTDGDGIGDNADTDDDGDSYSDDQDAFPKDPTEWLDTDNDGVGNNADTDDDNDGVEDTLDAFPLDRWESVDTDNDGIGDNADTDDDGDGYDDGQDHFPKDPLEWLDTDGDGIGNNADPDDDNDSHEDSVDLYPLNPYEWADTDGDGIGDNADTDDDNDGVEDFQDFYPTDANRSQFDASGFLPMSPGSTWRYSSDSVNYVSSVDGERKIGGQTVNPLSFSSGSKLYLKVVNNEVRFYGFYLPQVSTAYGNYSTDIMLKDGFSITNAGGYVGSGVATIKPKYGNKSIQWDARTREVGLERITVKAGTFDTVHSRIEVTATTEIDGYPMSVSYFADYWFASEVGLVKISESGAGVSPLELTDYSIADTSKETTKPKSGGSSGGSFGWFSFIALMGAAFSRRFKSGS